MAKKQSVELEVMDHKSIRKTGKGGMMHGTLPSYWCKPLGDAGANSCV